MAPRRGDAARPAERKPAGRDRVLKPNTAKSKRPPGRPFKLPRSGSESSLSQSSRSVSAVPSVPNALPRQRALSWLETLPVELIEMIFLYSLNLQLPYASPAIAAALSRERVYSILIILAFWDDPMSDCPLSPVMASMLAPLGYEPLLPAVRSRLQEAVFRCRWCTMTRLRDQIPKIFNLTLHRLWINTQIEMEPDQLAALNRFMQRQDTSTTMFHGKESSNGPLTGLLRSRNGLISLSTPDGDHVHEYELHVRPNVRIEIHSRTLDMHAVWPAIQLDAFPSQLLAGRNVGFAAEDVTYLELLRLCSNNFCENPGISHLCSASKVNRMAVQRGIRNAIRNQNLPALVSLLKIDEHVHRFGIKLAGNMHYTIPSDHFVMVALGVRNNPQQNLAFFEALLRASAESLPPDSPEITQWMVENVDLAERSPGQHYDSNGKFAHWLSNFLIRLPLYLEHVEKRPGDQLFFCGKLNVQRPEGNRYFEYVLQPEREPPQCYMAESSFHPEEYWLKANDSLA